MIRAVSGWCVRHRAVVVGLWLAVVVGTSVAAHVVGPRYSSDYRLPGTDSTRALDLLRAAAPSVSGDVEQVVYVVPVGHDLDDADVKAAVEASLARVAALPHVTRISSPYAPRAQQVGLGGTVGFANVYLDVPAAQIGDAATKRFVTTARSVGDHEVRADVLGPVAEDSVAVDLGGIWLGVGLAALVLALVFGSLFATLLPLASALGALGTAVAANTLLTHVVPTPLFARELVLLIGLGVGIDYALFVVSRHRQQVMAGRPVEESISTALETSGRAVAFAGTIVCLGLLAMLALGIRFLDGTTVDAVLGVLLTMTAALTLLPALLGFLGTRVLSRRERQRLAAGEAPRHLAAGGWARWADAVRRRPVVPALAALAVIVLMAVPLHAIRLGQSDAANDPRSSTTRDAYDALARGFGPGFTGPLVLVAVTRSDADTAALKRVATAVIADPGIAHVGTPSVLPARGGTVVLVSAYAKWSPQDPRTADLIQRLRHTVIPRALGTDPTAVYVGGSTATYVDLSRVLGDKLPLFVTVVALVAMLLLALVFRSVLVPLTAAAMNLLSSAAAFGVLVAVFQWGWLGSWVGVDRPGPVEPYVPILLFAILFGLSMDYEVFLVSRMQEEWLRHGDVATGVRNGLAATGRTITAAALVMILVFGSFVLSGERVIKEFGLGLAAGIAVDAVVVRSMLIPSVMLLLGRANWWFPAALARRLPRLPEHLPLDEPRELERT